MKVVSCIQGIRTKLRITVQQRNPTLFWCSQNCCFHTFLLLLSMFIAVYLTHGLLHWTPSSNKRFSAQWSGSIFSFETYICNLLNIKHISKGFICITLCHVQNYLMGLTYIEKKNCIFYMRKQHRQLRGLYSCLSINRLRNLLKMKFLVYGKYMYLGVCVIKLMKNEAMDFERVQEEIYGRL